MSHPSVTTILLLSASPKGDSSQRLEQEKRNIAEGLQRSRWRDRFRLEIKSAVRPRDLQPALLDFNPQIVQFSGEGEAEGLVFEDETGRPQPIATDALAELLAQFADRLQCVVLNACYLEAQADAIAQYIPLQVSLEIFREIGDRANESEALLRLAELHQKTGSIDLARQVCDRALALAIELGIPLVKECETLKQQLEEENNGSDR
jgi:hypothetical protein